MFPVNGICCPLCNAEVKTKYTFFGHLATAHEGQVLGLTHTPSDPPSPRYLNTCHLKSNLILGSVSPPLPSL